MCILKEGGMGEAKKREEKEKKIRNKTEPGPALPRFRFVSVRHVGEDVGLRRPLSPIQ